MSVEQCRKKLQEIAIKLNDIKEIDAMEMLRFLMKYGEQLPALPDDKRIKAFFVNGCISNAYVYVEKSKTGNPIIMGDSDVMLVKGFIGILSLTCQMLSMGEMCMRGKELIGEFLDVVDLDIILTPTRANAFGNIVFQISKQAEKL